MLIECDKVSWLATTSVWSILLMHIEYNLGIGNPEYGIHSQFLRKSYRVSFSIFVPNMELDCILELPDHML
jgi:hypothetical protein